MFTTLYTLLIWKEKAGMEPLGFLMTMIFDIFLACAIFQHN